MTQEPTSAELLNAWTAAKKAADEYEDRQNQTQTLLRGDYDAEFRSEGGFYEIDRLRSIESEAHRRYLEAITAGR